MKTWTIRDKSEPSQVLAVLDAETADKALARLCSEWFGLDPESTLRAYEAMTGASSESLEIVESPSTEADTIECAARRAMTVVRAKWDAKRAHR